MLRDEADEALMARYRQGEVPAFEILLGRHQRPIFNFILRYVGSRAVAEELTQETFLRVIKSAESYQRQAKLTTWLYTIARNLCVDHSRRQKHRRARSLDAPLSNAEDGSGTLLDVIEDEAIPQDRLAQSEKLRQRMTAAIAKLSDEQREVFIMRELLDLPFKEIAQVVGAPENTVKSRMRYALEKLREELADYRDLARAAP